MDFSFKPYQTKKYINVYASSECHDQTAHMCSQSDQDIHSSIKTTSNQIE